MKIIQNKNEKRKYLAVVNYLIVAVFAVILAWLLVQFEVFHTARSTDNAQVRRQLLHVNARVQGYIKDVCVQEYAHVNEGDLLVTIDDSEYQLHLKDAQARLASASAGRDVLLSTIDTLNNKLLVSDSAIAEANVRLENARRELKRNEALLAENVVTQSQFDNMKTDEEALEIHRDMLVKEKKSIELTIKEQKASLEAAESGILQAQASVDLAKLNLSYTKIVAPCSGYLGRKNLEAGQLVQPGQVVFDIVDDSDTWVVANFKEKVLKDVSVGSKVEIHIDACPDTVFTGTVSSLSDATGASYSLLPSDNSTGNYVRVEQLVPVRIAFTDDSASKEISALKNGLSATVKIL